MSEFFVEDDGFIVFDNIKKSYYKKRLQVLNNVIGVYNKLVLFKVVFLMKDIDERLIGKSFVVLIIDESNKRVFYIFYSEI